MRLGGGRIDYPRKPNVSSSQREARQLYLPRICGHLDKPTAYITKGATHFRVARVTRWFVPHRARILPRSAI